MENNYETLFIMSVSVSVSVSVSIKVVTMLLNCPSELSIIIGYNLVQVHHLLLVSLFPVLNYLYLGILAVNSLCPMQLATGLTGRGVLQSLLR